MKPAPRSCTSRRERQKKEHDRQNRAPFFQNVIRPVSFLVNDGPHMFPFKCVQNMFRMMQGVYNLNGKPIPGRYKNGVKEGGKYFTPKGMARSGVR